MIYCTGKRNRRLGAPGEERFPLRVLLCAALRPEEAGGRAAWDEPWCRRSMDNYVEYKKAYEAKYKEDASAFKRKVSL